MCEKVRHSCSGEVGLMIKEDGGHCVAVTVSGCLRGVWVANSNGTKINISVSIKLIQSS